MAELLIRPLDPRDDADMDAFQDLYAAAERHEDPAVGLYSREDGIAMLTSTDGSSLFEAWGAFVEGRMVAEAILMGATRDNVEVAHLLLWVHPDHRGRGYGSSMLASVEDHARALGRTLLLAHPRIGGHLVRNESFAERHGYTLSMTEIERRRPLPVEPELLDRLAAEAAPFHVGYRIETYVGRLPVELHASYVALRNLLGSEAPHGDRDVEVGRHTVDDFDALETEREQAGRTAVRAIAVHDGAAVAHADASVPGGDATHVDQLGTLVHPDHRGHRLGIAVKCAQLRVLSERFADRAYIQTGNAETNEHMVAINVALGFGVHQVWGEFEKRLAPATSE